MNNSKSARTNLQEFQNIFIPIFRTKCQDSMPAPISQSPSIVQQGATASERELVPTSNSAPILSRSASYSWALLQHRSVDSMPCQFLTRTQQGPFGTRGQRASISFALAAACGS